MEELSDKVGPGTAGVAQRIYKTSDEQDSTEEVLDNKLYVLRSHRVMSCSHNQF